MLNIKKFQTLPQVIRLKLIKDQPLLKVVKLPVGNSSLLAGLEIGQIVLNKKQVSYVGKQTFLTIKHGEKKEFTSTFSIDYFTPVR